MSICTVSMGDTLVADFYNEKMGIKYAEALALTMKDFNSELVKSGFEVRVTVVRKSDGDIIYDNLEEKKYKFDNISCSQCGRRFGPGDHGYSHCKNHKGKRGEI